MNGETSNGGVVIDLKTLAATDLRNSYLVRDQGCLDGRIHRAILPINVFGFDRVSETDNLERHTAFRAMMRNKKPQIFGTRRRNIDPWFSGGCEGTAPSTRAIYDRLSRFQDIELGRKRITCVAVVPKPPNGLSAVGAATLRATIKTETAIRPVLIF